MTACRGGGREAHANTGHSLTEGSHWLRLRTWLLELLSVVTLSIAQEAQPEGGSVVVILRPMCYCVSMLLCIVLSICDLG